MSPDAPAPAALAFGPFVLDLAGGRLLRDGHAVDLAPRPWAVLVHLAEREGRLVGKDELLDAVWGHRHVSDSVLKVAINSLRAALGDDAAAPRYIETAARRGYRFAAQVGAVADARSAAPPPGPVGGAAAPAARAGNLPEAAAELVGREAAMAELRGLLAGKRLVTLLGPGGVGKTQLALATARLDAPPDGVWLVRLEALADATPLLDTVARALSLGANASRSAEALARALAPLSMRVVLDNAEHLIAAVAPLVVQCLAQASRLQVLVTSQTPLRVAGEVLMPLLPLDLPPAGAAAAALDFPAVALFVARVRAALPQFTPDARMAEDMAALCRLLDGLPLAIELAAARVPLLGTAGVLARISDRFALLSRGARDASQRHRTLRHALEWSFGLLGRDELRVLRRLSVFAGTFTPALAQAVAAEPGDGEWQVLDALQNLQEQSLLTADPAHDAPRLRQLESVRALAAEHLRAAGEEEATRTRLALAMRDLFQAAQAQYTRTPLLHWLRPLRPEADNLRLAMAHALGQLAAPGAPEEQADRLRLAVELYSHAMLFWLRSGRKREAQLGHDALAPHVQRLHEPGLRAAFGLALGALAAYGQSLPPADALPWLEEAEQQFARLGDGRSAMLAVYLIAALNQRVAPHHDRTPLLRRMRALEQPDWSPRERNFAAWTEAVNAHGHGDLLAFRDFCAGDLERARTGDDRAEAWVAAFGLGQALWALGEQRRAAQTLSDAVDDLRACGLLREYATTAALAASMRIALDDPDGEAAAREAADLLRAEGMLWWMGDALMALAARRGDWPAALRLRAWIDGRMDALGMKRSPVAAGLLELFDQWLGEARAGPRWREPEAAPAGVTDDAEVLRLSFG
jgi:predicted ATPase/DNA-binding winged helix-turn-helix (wHTH) protein